MDIIEINDWNEFKLLVSDEKMPSWIFRGQSDSNWQIISSLSRYFQDFKVHPDSWSHQEERLLRIFKRKAYHYLEDVPKDSDSFEWLSIMQHFGTPTRLIDFTFSPYVAAFFALQKTKTDCAVWALFPPRFDCEAEIKLRNGRIINPKDLWLRVENNYQKYFLPGTESILIMGEPERMNQRLIAQAGTFIIPGVLNKSAEEIVLDNYIDGENAIKKFVLKKSIRDVALKDLYRSNITEATLFPGIDGMARALAYELEHHWAYNPKTMTRLPGFDNPPFGLPKGIK
jgi:hypothetical protein